MLFLDSIYYTCCNYYKKKNDDTFKASGIILLAVLLSFNIIFLVIFIDHFQPMGKQLFYKYVVFSMIFYLLGLLPILYVRYFRITTFEKVNAKLNNLPENKRAMYLLVAFLYIMLSIVTCLGMAFYLGGIKNGWW